MCCQWAAAAAATIVASIAATLAAAMIAAGADIESVTLLRQHLQELFVRHGLAAQHSTANVEHCKVLMN